MKKVLGFTSLVAMAVTVFVATQNVGNARDLKLSSLVKLTNANAECLDSQIPGWNNGVCSFAGNCYMTGGNPNCATSGGW